MTIMKTLAMFGMAAMLTGCIPSLNPLYTEVDLVQDPALEGVWVEDGDPKNRLAFFRSSDGAGYEMLLLGASSTEVFTAHLTQIGDHRYLDIYPKEVSMSDTYKDHYLAVHTFYRISVEGKFLRLSSIDGERLEKKIERRELTIEHARIKKDLVLTAPTEQLRRMVAALAADPDPEVFTKPDVYRRLP